MSDRETREALAGVGLDAEQVRRFGKLADGAPPWRRVYAPDEAERLAAHPERALAFCAAFCCKEALCKALREPFPFVECRCEWTSGDREPRIVLAPALAARRRVAEVRVRLHERFLAERGECVVEVQVFRAPDSPPVRSSLASLATALGAAERERVVAEHFTPSEIADLGARGVQSLAGALALKRALAALWAEAGRLEAAEERDFVLSHDPGGAPKVSGAPAGPSGVLVSIAHTRAWAYGLAALPVPARRQRAAR